MIVPEGGFSCEIAASQISLHERNNNLFSFQIFLVGMEQAFIDSGLASLCHGRVAAAYLDQVNAQVFDKCIDQTDCTAAASRKTGHFVNQNGKGFFAACSNLVNQTLEFLAGEIRLCTFVCAAE